GNGKPCRSSWTCTRRWWGSRPTGSRKPTRPTSTSRSRRASTSSTPGRIRPPAWCSACRKPPAMKLSCASASGPPPPGRVLGGSAPGLSRLLEVEGNGKRRASQRGHAPSFAPSLVLRREEPPSLLSLLRVLDDPRRGRPRRPGSADAHGHRRVGDEVLHPIAAPPAAGQQVQCAPGGTEPDLDDVRPTGPPAPGRQVAEALDLPPLRHHDSLQRAPSAKLPSFHVAPLPPTHGAAVAADRAGRTAGDERGEKHVRPARP